MSIRHAPLSVTLFSAALFLVGCGDSGSASQNTINASDGMNETLLPSEDMGTGADNYGSANTTGETTNSTVGGMSGATTETSTGTSTGGTATGGTTGTGTTGGTTTTTTTP